MSVRLIATPGLSPAGSVRARLRRDRLAMIALGCVALAVLFAVLAPLVCTVLGAPGPSAVDAHALTRFGTATGPSSSHLFGVDPQGRDVFARVVYGARASLLAALGGTALGAAIGLALGVAAGLRGGVIGRSLAALLPFPAVVLVIGVASACTLGHGCLVGAVAPGAPVLILVLTLLTVGPVARAAREQTVLLLRRQFVARAGRGRVTRVVLPNLAAPILLTVVTRLPQSVLWGAALSFLGVGSASNWGGMLHDASAVDSTAWWLLLFPGAALTLTVLALSTARDGLRRALGSDG